MHHATWYFTILHNITHYIILYLIAMYLYLRAKRVISDYDNESKWAHNQVFEIDWRGKFTWRKVSFLWPSIPLHNPHPVRHCLTKFWTEQEVKGQPSQKFLSKLEFNFIFYNLMVERDFSCDGGIRTHVQWDVNYPAV